MNRPMDSSEITLTSGQDVGQPSQGRQLACRQCRARKVKCDRRQSGCLRCARLDLVCSYISGESTASALANSQLSPQELTQAGTKRRRIRRACSACRLMKAKCSGTQPCSRCQSLQQPCRYPDAASVSGLSPQDLPIRAQPLESPVSVQTESYGSEPTPVTASSFESDMTRVFNAEKKEVVREYISAFFDKTDLAECQFLHRATVVVDWNNGQLDANLLKAICASGMRLLCLDHPMDKSIPQRWMDEVQRDVGAQVTNTSIPQLQTLLLLIKFRFACRIPEDAWMLLSLAARIAFTKRLNYERPTADPIRQECLRRLMWTVFYLDKIFSGGIEDLTLCPTERIHIRLPSNDRCFQRGLKSRSHFLRDPGDSEADMDALAYRIKIYDVRDRIFRYTRGVILEKSSPFITRDELQALDQELELFETTLPAELGTDKHRLMLMCHSAEARTYIMLHSTIHLCRCDLYRFLIPGIREAVSPEAMEKTPQEYIDHCQRRCLESALRLCDFWGEIYHLKTHRPIDSPTLAIAIYQVTKIIDNLCHLLPEDGDRSLGQLKVKLSHIVTMLGYSRRAFAWVPACCADIERLIMNLGLRTRSPGTPPSAEMVEAPNRLHRRSKFAFAPDASEHTDPVVDEQSPAREAWAAPIQSFSDTPMDTQGDWQGARDNDGQAVDPYYTGYSPLNPHSLTYGTVEMGSTSLEHPDMSMAMDPFDLHLNAYADAHVPSVFSAMDQQN